MVSAWINHVAKGLAGCVAAEVVAEESMLRSRTRAPTTTCGVTMTFWRS
jgi:hypothetical protein